MTMLALLPPLVAVFVVLTSATAALLALGGRLVTSPHALPSSLHAAVIFAPAIAGVLGCVALAFPDLFAPCHCAEHGLHHPHLCPYHPAFALALLAPSAGVVGAWLSLVAPRLLLLARAQIASARQIRAVRRLPTRRVDDVDFRLTDGDSRTAVTMGAWSPIIVVDRLLWDGLSDEERRAMLHHEHAHVERRDGLTVLLLRLAAALYPVPLGSQFIAGWRSAVERACDRHAAAVIGDASVVAGALVAVEKSRRGDTATGALSALGIVSGGELESRVMALLDEPESHNASALGNDVLTVGLVALGAGALTAVWPGGSCHHTVETLLGVFLH